MSLKEGMFLLKDDRRNIQMETLRRWNLLARKWTIFSWNWQACLCCPWNLTNISFIQSTLSKHNSVKFILMLFAFPDLSLTIDVPFPNFLLKYMHFVPPVNATFPIHLIPFKLIVVTILVEELKLKSYSLCHNIFLGTIFSNTTDLCSSLRAR
jgi:hypothetical protein